MDGKINTRPPGSVPRSLGRQIGVLPVANPPPRVSKRSSENSSSLRIRRPSSSERRSASNTSLHSLQSATPATGHKKPPSPGSKQIKSRSPQQGGDDEYEYEDFYEQDIRFTDSSSRSSSVTLDSSRNRSVNSSRPSSAEKKKVVGNRTVKSKTRLQNVGGSSNSSRLTSASVTNVDDGRVTTPEIGEDVQKPPKTVDSQEVLQQNFETDHNKIYEICMHAAELTTIGNLEKFKKLRVLDLSCNYIMKIENLDQNKDLRQLKLYDNKIKTIENLQELKELCILQLQHNKIKQIGKGLNALKKLKILRLDCNQILKLEASDLSSCIQLTTIDISNNMIDNLSALNYLPNLEELSANGNRLKSVDVSRCKKLNEVNVADNRITELSGLKGLMHLKILNVANNNLVTLKSLGKSKTLIEIHAACNKISELSYFSNHYPRLEIIDMTRNSIQHFDEVCSLKDLEDLAELFISENPFCAPGGELPHYMADTQSALPQLEILDGARLHRPSQKSTAPLMRPMSASTIVSVRQMETQLKTADEQMQNFQKNIQELFDTLKETYERLPARPPSEKSPGEMPRPSSKSSSRSRLKDAMRFASENFDD